MKQFSKFTLRFSNCVSLNKVLNINYLKWHHFTASSFLSFLSFPALDKVLTSFVSLSIYFRILHLKFKIVFQLPISNYLWNQWILLSPADFTREIKVTGGRYLGLFPTSSTADPLSSVSVGTMASPHPVMCPWFLKSWLSWLYHLLPLYSLCLLIMYVQEFKNINCFVSNLIPHLALKLSKELLFSISYKMGVHKVCFSWVHWQLLQPSLIHWDYPHSWASCSIHWAFSVFTWHQWEEGRTPLKIAGLQVKEGYGIEKKVFANKIHHFPLRNRHLQDARVGLVPSSSLSYKHWLHVCKTSQQNLLVILGLFSFSKMDNWRVWFIYPISFFCSRVWLSSGCCTKHGQVWAGYLQFVRDRTNSVDAVRLELGLQSPFLLGRDLNIHMSC